MKNTLIQNLNEAFERVHKLNEMSTVSTPLDKLPKNTKICVYGENDEPGTKTPHFHVIIDNGKIELEVKIEHINKLEIWRTKGGYPKSWNGLSDIKKAIQEWLYKESSYKKIMFKTTNWRLIGFLWNTNNPSQQIDEEFMK